MRKLYAILAIASLMSASFSSAVAAQDTQLQLAGCTIIGVNDDGSITIDCGSLDLSGNTQVQNTEPAVFDETTSYVQEPSSFNTGSMPNLPRDLSHDGWTIRANENIGADPIVRDWLGRLNDPAPGRWRTFPNVPNPDVPGFRVNDCGDNDPSTRCVPDGVEYGVASVPFCMQDQTCDIPVPGWHYRLITGDYSFLGETCGAEGTGCLLLLVNVGEQTVVWRDQHVDAGFSVPGRYWNGDALEWGIWGLVSHASANMLNMPTKGLGDQVLNTEGGANAGANCGTVHGCNTVDILVVVSAVDRILATARTTVSR